jgi:hypothetical protein
MTPDLFGAPIRASLVRELLDYAPDTGVLTWRVALTSFIKVGQVAGKTDKRGYSQIGIGRRNYMAHRLAWLHVHGTWPPNQIDHINGNPADNRISNLRLATASQNIANSRLHCDSTSGLKGICFVKKQKRWAARIQRDGRRRYVGFFDTAEEAHAAYCHAAQELFGEFANAGRRTNT